MALGESTEERALAVRQSRKADAELLRREKERPPVRSQDERDSRRSVGGSVAAERWSPLRAKISLSLQ